MKYIHHITGMLLLALGPLAGCTVGGGYHPLFLGHVSKAQQISFLKTHNAIRKKLGITPLRWSNKLAQAAQQWANTLQRTKQCHMHHATLKKMGENLAYADWCCKKTHYPLLSPKEVVQYWAQESDYYDYTTNQCQAKQQCGHYTQIVWAKTRYIGCGVAHCINTEDPKQITTRELWVCRYSPPGNFVGQHPY
jgi:pathogenesis-related protein 1